MSLGEWYNTGMAEHNKVKVSLPPSLYRRLNLWADKNEMSLEDAIVKVLQEAVAYDMMELGSFYQE